MPRGQYQRQKCPPGCTCGRHSFHGGGTQPRPRQLLELTDVQAAWLGALVDGEGSIIAHPRGTYYVVVANSEVELLATCLRITGAGRVNFEARKPSHLGFKPMWRWILAAKADVDALLHRIAPFSLKAQEYIDAA